MRVPRAVSRTAESQPAAVEAPPRYRRIAAQLKEEILAGLYPVGSLLPTEAALGRRFAASRHTVREALRLLREEGLVASRRGAGTRVVSPGEEEGAVQQVMSINDLLAFARESRLEIEAVGVVALDADAARRVELPEGSRWLGVSGVRRGREGAALCRADYWIHLDYAAVARLLPRHAGPIFPLIEDLYGERIAEVEQAIRAVPLAAADAASLGAAAGGAALEVRRTYRTAAGKVVQVTINTHPGERFAHRTTLRRLRPA
ncbi:MAG: GntR family transcriptional regulator [Porticoccaceae bacterium]|nr:MAG: GntR family transcriptional regulator [Porticoccaceae bacterium]